MRILYCNKYNFAFSGTEAYLFAAMRLMRAHGHEAALFSMADDRGEATPFDQHFVPHLDFKNEGGWLHKAALAGHAIYSPLARKKMRAMIAEFRPEVAHVRNIYHHLSPSILWELRAQKVPVVYHLNDFKVLCPSYNLVLRGEACEACKGGAFWNAMKKKCYPGRAARGILVTEAYLHRILGTYRKCVDCFLAPSQFVKDKFIEHGWDAAKFEVLPHFQLVDIAKTEGAHDGPILYFGRLSREKGVADLIRAMHSLPHLRLVIAGEGEERQSLERMSAQLGTRNVEFVGHLNGAELQRTIASSRFTALPSHAYETLGKTILESHAQARAVVASDMGSRRELIENGKTGLLYRTGDVSELSAAIEFLSSHPTLAGEMGRAGRERVRRDYTPESHYRAMMNIYEGLIAKKNAPPQGVKRESSPPPLSKQNSLLQSSLQRRGVRVAFIGGRGVLSKYSGIETYYEEVGRRLAQRGHQVTAYCRTYFTPAAKEHEGMKIVRLATFRSKHLETVVHTFLSTLHALTQPCDIVHYHALGPALFSFIPRLAGKKTVVTVQGLDWKRRKWSRLASGILQLGEQAAIDFPNATMVVSRTLQKHFLEKHSRDTVYIPNGGLLRERRLPEKILDWGLEPQGYILFMGRFSPEKGCHVLVRAYEQLRTDVKLVMAGGATYCDDYSRELRTHASERIKLLDWVSGEALEELLTNAAVFVLPSDLEGLSLALLDAMGAGLCVLASDVPENCEAVEDAGFTFHRGDAGDLAERLRFLLANPSVREAAGRAARQRAREHYQWSGIAMEVELEYFKLLGWDAAKTGRKKQSGRATEPAPAPRRKTG